MFPYIITILILFIKKAGVHQEFGDKSTQDEDIKTAKAYWESYKEEKNNADS